MTDRGRYLFAVATGLRPGDLAGREGLDGEEVEIVEHDGLQAVVCDVDLGEFGEEPVRHNLEQLEWVEKVARAHDAVVRAIADRATVAPLRLVTVCLDDDSVIKRLQQWEAPLRAALERVKDCREWSVKAYQADIATSSTGTDEGPARVSGTAYLQRKREQSSQRQLREVQAAETAQALHVALAGRSRASRLLTPQDPQLTGRRDPMILNGAYLLPHADEDRFRSVVDDLQSRYPDVMLEIAGPWAPYSFAVLEVAHDG
jgi:Gas vesicle synthesis protein GvpL/GvpF